MPLFGELLLNPSPAVKDEYPESAIIEIADMVEKTRAVEKLTNVIIGALGAQTNIVSKEQLANGEENEAIKARPTVEQQQLSETVVNKLLTHVSHLGVAPIRALLQLQRNAELNTVHALELLETKDFKHVMQSFVELLRVEPLASRRACLGHLDIQLGKKSAVAQDECQRRIDQLNREKATLVTSHSQSQGQGSLKSSASMRDSLVQGLDRLKDAIDNAYTEFHARNLGLEHFLRETGCLFELSLKFPNNPIVKPFRDTPFLVAQMLLDGVAIELLDGDLNEMSGAWLEAVFHSVCIQAPNLRVFVVSILGLQSSGKSTLLNALFGCQFAVSAGRCTRGLFVRILYLDPELRKQFGVDVLLLIDTEGLGSPELVNKDYQKQDRLMAAFAVCISNLTLINVRGVTNDMAGILEIVIVILARLEKADISPDILLIQHLSQRSGTKLTAEGLKEFYNCLDNALMMVDKKEMELCIRNSNNVSQLKQSVQSGQILIPFGTFKDGGTDFAPPSPQYHSDVQQLYAKILDRIGKHGRDSTLSPTLLHTWHSNLYSYWAAVKSEDFVRQFQNIREMSDFLERSTLCGRVKQLIDSAFRGHHVALISFIDANIHALDKFPGDKEYARQMDEVVEQTIRDYLASIPNTCDAAEDRTSCTKCRKAVTKMQQLLGKSASSTTGQESVFSRVAELQSDVETYLTNLRANEYKFLMDVWTSKKLVQRDGHLFHQHIELLLQEEPHNKNVEELAQKVLHRTESAIKQRYSQLPPLTDRLKSDFLKVYEEASVEARTTVFTMLDAEAELDVIKRRLEEADAFKDGMKRKVVTLFKRKSVGSRLQLDEMNFLDRTFNELPLAIMNDNSKKDGGSVIAAAGKYETGMLHDLKHRIARALERVERKCGKLVPTFKWNLVAYALKLFAMHMESVEKEWNLQNQPLAVLKARKEYFVKQLSWRFLPTTSIEKQGVYIARKLIEALQQHVTNHLEKLYSRRLLERTGNWIRSVDLTRLKFLTTLALEVDQGNYLRALEHFERPRTTFLDWCRTEIDTIYKTEIYSREDDYECFRTALFNMLGVLKESSQSRQDFEAYVHSFVGSSVQMDLSSVDDVKELATLFSVVENSCWDQQQLRFNDIELRSPFPDYVGCTAACTWCGAICWGLKDHEKGFSMLTKHHTCHQPRGLTGTIDMRTEELVPTSCDHVTEEGERVELGKVESNNYLFFDEKNIELDFWIYKQHPKRQCEELVRWLYIKLLPKLAQRYNAKPTSVDSLNQAGFGNVGNKDLHPILALIQALQCD